MPNVDLLLNPEFTDMLRWWTICKGNQAKWLDCRTCCKL